MDPLACPSEQEICAFQLGDLPETALDQLAEHMESCPRCESIAQRLDARQDAILSAIRLPQPRRKRARALGLALLVVTAASTGLGIAYAWQSHTPAPAPRTQEIATDPETIVHIRSLEPTAAENWPLPRGPKGGLIKDPYTSLSIDGKPSPHGIGMHPGPNAPARLTYPLGKRFRRFRASVSLNDSSARSNAPMTFTVHGDNAVLWQSTPITTRAETQECDVPVQDVDVLKLEVTAGPRSFGAHGVWIEPRLTK